MWLYCAYSLGHRAGMYAAHVMNDAACMGSATSSKLRGYGYVPRYRLGHCASMYAAHVMNHAACTSSNPSSRLRGYGYVPRIWA